MNLDRKYNIEKRKVGISSLHLSEMPRHAMLCVFPLYFPSTRKHRSQQTIEPELGSSNNSSREQTQRGSQQGEPHSTLPPYPGLRLTQWGS